MSEEKELLRRLLTASEELAQMQRAQAEKEARESYLEPFRSEAAQAEMRARNSGYPQDRMAYFRAKQALRRAEQSYVPSKPAAAPLTDAQKLEKLRKEYESADRMRNNDYAVWQTKPFSDVAKSAYAASKRKCGEIRDQITALEKAMEQTAQS